MVESEAAVDLKMFGIRGGVPEKRNCLTFVVPAASNNTQRTINSLIVDKAILFIYSS